MAPIDEKGIESIKDPNARVEVRLALLERGQKDIERRLDGIQKVMVAIFIAVALMVLGSFWQFVVNGGLSAGT